MEKVIRYYSQFDEWARLDSAAGQLEFLRTMSLIQSHVQAGSKILDLGGGPGRYSIELAKLDYIPQLVDLSPKLIESAVAKFRLAGISNKVPVPQTASATDLGEFKAEFFDCVLALGPFYHLIDSTDRKAAVLECARVLKPGGIFIAAFIPKLSGVAGLLYRSAHVPHHVRRGTITRTFETGIFQNSSDEGFQDGYYMPLPEARSLFTSDRIVELQCVSIKGLFAGREEWAIKTKQNDPNLFSEMLDVVAKTAMEPSVIEMSDHALFIGRKV